ncbi:MAG: putative DNA binding domain-containing protein [Acidobacteria bacterium]|nr:putative DNA binding domain-containing protein [Acidobacteriota bacterium]
MSRKRHNHSQRPRQQLGSERSYYAYQFDVPAQLTSRAELVRLLRGGEDTFLELKVRYSNAEKITAEIIALANTAGGAMIFGVNDQLRIEGVENPEEVEEELRDICAHQIQPPVFPYINKVAFDSGRRIVILEVDSADRPHRTLDDRFYLREGAIKREASREELSRIYHETYRIGFEQVPLFQADIENDIDESLLWSYVRAVNPGYWGENTKGYPNDVVMRDMGLAVKIQDDWLPTVGGLMLFGLNNRIAELMPRTDVLLTRYSGPHQKANNLPVIESVRLQGNLLRQADGSLNFLKRYVDLREARPSRKTRENGLVQSIEEIFADSYGHFVPGRSNYHRSAIIETLTNFLVHRDLSARDRQARINIYDDCIEFVNPAQPPELPMVSLRYGLTCPPNPRVKAIFTNRHYGTALSAETICGGVAMVCAETINFARRAPEGPSLTNNEFRLKLYGLQ